MTTQLKKLPLGTPIELERAWTYAGQWVDVIHISGGRETPTLVGEIASDSTSEVLVIHANGEKTAISIELILDVAVSTRPR